MRKALITGITGQDGSYLAEFLLEKDYEVHGTMRRASTFNTGRFDHLYKDPHVNNVRLFLHYGDIADSTNLIRLLYRIQPHEVYPAAQSHVRVSFDIPEYTGDVTALGTVRLLEAIRETGVKSKFYQVRIKVGLQKTLSRKFGRQARLELRPRIRASNVAIRFSRQC